MATQQGQDPFPCIYAKNQVPKRERPASRLLGGNSSLAVDPSSAKSRLRKSKVSWYRAARRTVSSCCQLTRSFALLLTVFSSRRWAEAIEGIKGPRTIELDPKRVTSGNSRGGISIASPRETLCRSVTVSRAPAKPLSFALSVDAHSYSLLAFCILPLLEKAWGREQSASTRVQIFSGLWMAGKR